MDIEQLKMILEMVKVVSGDATMIAMVYIILPSALKLIGLSAILFTLYKVIYIVNYVDKEKDFLSALSRRLDVNIYMSDIEQRNELFKKLNELVDKNES